MSTRILAGLLLGAALAGCGGGDLETRTFEVQYLPSHEVRGLIEPYVFTERDGRPGTMSAMDGAVTVRETEDNLQRIERVLEQFDRPRPSVMLHFQIIEANGAADLDPAIADVERELRRLFRFDGYELVAEAQMGGIQGTGFQQAVRGEQAAFVIRGGVTEVRQSAESPTVTVDVELRGGGWGEVLQTTVTIPAGHSVVLGTATAPALEGALILVVRADIVEPGISPSPDSVPAP